MYLTCPRYGISQAAKLRQWNILGWKGLGSEDNFICVVTTPENRPDNTLI